MSKWVWYRFKANGEDYRPTAFPPPGPYWCSGHGGDEDADEGSYFIICAYLPEGVNLFHFWPDAHDIDSEPRDEIRYSSRFPKPDWYKGGTKW